MAEHDDEQAARLLALLAQDVPDSTLSIERAIADGRTRRRRRRYAATGAIAVVAALAVALPVMLPRQGPGTVPGTGPSDAGIATGGPTVPPASGPPSAPAPPAGCRPQLLPGPPGATDSMVTAGDPTGRYLAGSVETAGGWSAAIWDRGRMTTLNPPGPMPAVVAVNAVGMVVGFNPESAKSGSGPDSGAWIYRAGQLSALARLPGDAGDTRYVVDGINATGDVIGYATRTPSPPAGGGPGNAPVQGTTEASAQLVVWPAASPQTPRAMAAPAGTVFVAAAKGNTASIEDDGWVFALVRAASGVKPGLSEVDGYSWSPTGDPIKLDLPAGFGSGYGFAHGGWMLGTLGADPGISTVLDLRTNRVIKLPLSFQPSGAVNRWGWSTGVFQSEIPAAISAGRVTPLPMPADAGKLPGGAANSISDAGDTIGGTVDIAGHQRAAMWTCR